MFLLIQFRKFVIFCVFVILELFLTLFKRSLFTEIINECLRYLEPLQSFFVFFFRNYLFLSFV